jgi:hypothetical protein
MINRRYAAVVALAIGTVSCSVPRAAAQQPAPAQRTFTSPDAAARALRAAVEIHDKAALHDIFGPGIRDLLTGDEAKDKANSQRFAKAIADGVKPVAEGEDKVILEIGANDYPFPIPLVKEETVWRFDTAAGKEEIINRRIGKDELHAIGICKSFIPAQKQYIGGGRGSSGAIHYAQKLRSAPGKMDGLYWASDEVAAPSPFGAKAAAAGVDGGSGPAPKAFHGYFFKVLTMQGPSAPGGEKNYVKDGNLVDGFALAAYPENWGKSGIMTFIVNQDGNIYQRDLGEKTSDLAAALTQYDPDGSWTLVKDEGVFEK